MTRRPIAALAALLSLLAGLAVLLPAAPALAASPLPADPKAKGYIGLCDEAGHNVTGGSIDTKPFVWKAVASQPPPAPFQGQGENAVLNVYQPRPQVPPGEWSGNSLTAATFYSTPHYPAVQATYQDLSLAQFTQNFPPLVDGLYVLRIYYGKANYGLYNASYPTTTIQVTGTTWRVIAGGTVNCGAAKGVSNEQLTGVASTRDTKPRAPAAGEQTAPAGRHGAITAPIAKPGSTAAADGTAPAAGSDMSPAASSRSASSGSMVWLVWLLIGAVAVLGAALVVVGRARRSPPPA